MLGAEDATAAVEAAQVEVAEGHTRSAGRGYGAWRPKTEPETDDLIAGTPPKAGTSTPGPDGLRFLH